MTNICTGRHPDWKIPADSMVTVSVEAVDVQAKDESALLNAWTLPTASNNCVPCAKMLFKQSFGEILTI